MVAAGGRLTVPGPAAGAPPPAGALAPLAAGVAPPPMTLARTGANEATGVTGAEAATSRETGTAACATGRDCTNAAAGTAVMPPRCSRFR